VGDSKAVYLVRGLSCLSRSSNQTNERPKKPNEPAPRSAPRDVGLKDLTLIFYSSAGKGSAP
jgi:hypothetical protein